MATQGTPALGLLLRRGQSWQHTNNLHQAIATYFKLVEYFPGTDEARRAEEQLLGLAQQLEADGKEHMATHIYNRLA